MTKDEYEDFALRYKGCGACFPMYHTLSRFEKMWFSAIQKDVAELEKENAELSNRNQELLESCEGATMMYKDLCKAKEIIQKLIANAPNTYSGTDVELQQKKMFSFQDAANKAEQFLSEVEK